jgi:RNA-directed DNA polymerase
LAELEREVLALQRELLDGAYRPRPLTTFQITDPKPRTISAAAFRDRVVHHALCAAMSPAFERFAVHHSYACRKGKGNRAAVIQVQRLTRRHGWFCKLDVRHFFETVDHRTLEDQLARRFKDRRALALVGRLLEVGETAPGVGLPIGNLTSQHFGNFYLGHLDHHALEVLRVGAWVRYMDDLLLFGPDKDRVRAWAQGAAEFLEGPLKLSVKREATVLAPVHVGVPFLGLRIWPAQIRLDGARARRFRRRFRRLEADLAAGRIDADGRERSAQSLVGWAAQADTVAFRRSFFARLEA